MVDFAQAIRHLHPKAEYAINANDYEQLEWMSKDIEKPSLEALNASWDSYILYKKSIKYKEDRRKEYASWEDQFDMMYWDQVNGTTNWKDSVAAVKTKFPKPE